MILGLYYFLFSGVDFSRIYGTIFAHIPVPLIAPGSANGRQYASGAWNLGSNPSPGAMCRRLEF